MILYDNSIDFELGIIWKTRWYGEICSGDTRSTYNNRSCRDLKRNTPGMTPIPLQFIFCSVYFQWPGGNFQLNISSQLTLHSSPFQLRPLSLFVYFILLGILLFCFSGQEFRNMGLIFAASHHHSLCLTFHQVFSKGNLDLAFFSVCMQLAC